jgi:hypothetical protein
MFTKHQKFEIFGQTLHPQWPSQTSKMPQELQGLNFNLCKQFPCYKK